MGSLKFEKMAFGEGRESGLRVGGFAMLYFCELKVQKPYKWLIGVFFFFFGKIYRGILDIIEVVLKGKLPPFTFLSSLTDFLIFAL